MQELQEMWVWFLGWEDLLEQEMVTHSSIITWKIPWTEAWRATVQGFAKSQTCFLNTGSWGGPSISIVYSLIAHRHVMSLFLGFLLGPIDLCVWFWAHIKFWLLYLCSVVCFIYLLLLLFFFALQYCIGFVMHQHGPPWVYTCSVVWNQKAWHSSFALLSQDCFGCWGVFHASI